MKFRTIIAVSVTSLLALSSAASAHVWNIGWKSVGGGLDFYGVSWHTGLVGGTGTVDDFAANNSGFVINGTNYSFATGSVVNMSDCSGLGALTTGSCDATWNALGLDGAIVSSQDLTGDIYGKYAVKSFTSDEVTNLLGLTSGANSLTFTTFAPNQTWAPRVFGSASVPINVVITPDDPSAVPLPAAIPLLATGLGFLGFFGRRKKRS